MVLRRVSVPGELGNATADVPAAARGAEPEAAGQYCYTDAASLLETKEHLVISLYADRDPDDDWEKAAGRLAAMVQARADLAAGNLRLLYLGWLLAVQSDDVDDADTEPPVPAGLGKLSEPLRAVADFLDVDQDLLAVAAQASPDAREDHDDGLAAWISSLKAQEKDSLLVRVAAGEGAAVQALLARRFRRARGGNEAAVPARTAAELWKAAGDRKAAREKAEEERRRERQARDAAVTLLSDLCALAERQGDKATFTSRFLSLREQHQRKPSLQERFDKAGLPRRV